LDAERMLSDAQFELDLMKMSNVEAQTAIQLRGFSAEAVRKYGDELRALNAEMERQREITQAMDGVRDSAANAFEGFISGSMSAKDAFRSFVDDVLANITRMISQNFTESLFGGFGQNGGGMFGGGLSSLFGSFFGGGLAGGGPVSGGTPYLVGENGPELFVPQTAGRIANNAEVRGMGRGGTTINISVEGQVDMRSRQQLAADVGRTSQRALARTG
jgi:phage-related minor tail protein